MVLTKAIVRDPPAVRHLRWLAPIMVVLAMALLAMLPGLLIHLGADSGPARSAAGQIVLDHSQ